MEFKEDSVVITYLENSFSGIALLSSSTFPLTYDETASDEVRDYIGQQNLNIEKVFVSVPDRWAITKFIDIPSMKGKGKGALANLMKFEIERHIPLEIDDVAFDFLVIDERDGKNYVVFVAVQNEKLNFVKEYLEKLSIEPDAITISSFAVLNSLELGGLSSGGWQDIIGIVRRSDVLGKPGEANISLYIDKTYASVAVTRDGICISLRSFLYDMNGEPEIPIDDISRHIAEVQSALSLERFNKLILAGDTSFTSNITDELNGKISEGVIHVDRIERFSGKLKDVEMNGLSSSIGACFGGLGIGTYRINLLPHQTDYEIRKFAPWAAKVFVVLILLMIVGIFATETIKQKKYLEKMEETLAANEPKVKTLEKLLSDINSLKEESKFLHDVRDNEMTLEILAELAGIMPKDSWVTNLNYEGGDLSDKEKSGGDLIINGYADSSSSLIPLLEDSPLFEEVEFVGPIKKTRDKEQFKLSARIVIPSGGESGVQ